MASIPGGGTLTYTLAADGSSDRVLLRVLTWSLERHGVQSVIAQWADFQRARRPAGLMERLRLAAELYPCDILFVHGDAEAQSPETRRREIREAIPDSANHVPVVPVRMTEAWLLFDEAAIRSAAGNPNGTQDLGLQPIRSLEGVSDPKQVLHRAITRASELNARRKRSLPVEARVHLISNYIDDFSPLDVLPGFAALQDDIRNALSRIER